MDSFAANNSSGSESATGGETSVPSAPAPDAASAVRAASAASQSPVAGGRWRSAFGCWIAALVSGALHLLAFPPFDAAATAYVFTLPLLLLCIGGLPRARVFGLAVFGGFWLSWTIILLWLRHIEPPWGLLAAVALAAILAVFPLLWFMAARLVVFRLAGLGLVRRIFLLFALAGWWVVLEWVRGWLFTGFPWLPLSASQWQLPVMLQPAAWTGHYGVSFILVYFNLALLQYLRNWLMRFEKETPLQSPLPDASEAVTGAAVGKALSGAQTATTGTTIHDSETPSTAENAHAPIVNGDKAQAQIASEKPEREMEEAAQRWRRESHFSGKPALGGGLGLGGDFGGGGSRMRVRVCPEFYLGLLFLMGSILLYQRTLVQMRERVPMFTAAVTQPWIPATLKWEPGQARQTVDVLEQLALEAAALSPRPDVIVWPETALPFSLLSDESPWMRNWTDNLVRTTGIPLLTGALAREKGELFNGLFYVSPQTGVDTFYYAKRRLVPFGEYRPLRTLLPFIDKVVPLQTDISAGQGATLVSAQIGGQLWRIGSLICYEDIFGNLGRESVLAGADLLLVITNDAWYGEDAGGYQHAAHSVLRAVETRRPLLRAGNHGWSGWIDEAGVVRGVFAEDSGNIYQRGVASFDLVRSLDWVGRPSFYVSRGDWFVGLCGVFSLWGGVFLLLPARRRRIA